MPVQSPYAAPPAHVRLPHEALDEGSYPHRGRSDPRSAAAASWEACARPVIVGEDGREVLAVAFVGVPKYLRGATLVHQDIEVTQ